MPERPSMNEVEAQFDKVPHVMRAPWTPEQVKLLNEFQEMRPMHPFTCNGGGGKQRHASEVILIAYEDGWRCSKLGCDYTQDWCWPWMATDEWKTLWTFTQEAMEDDDV